MKKFILPFLLLLLLVTPIGNSFAQSATGSAQETPVPSAEQDLKVKKIIDLVASSVAEQKLVSKVGILGTVVDSSSTKITLTSTNGQKRILDIDEITKFADPESKTYGISDIKKGDLIGVIGLLNKDTERILARFVSTTESVPTYFDGVITKIDPKNFQFTAVNENGDERIIDIVTSTKIHSFAKDDGQIKSGFSKVLIGERVHAAGFMDTKVKNQLDATRFTHFIDLQPSAKMKQFITVSPEENETVTPKPTVALDN